MDSYSCQYQKYLLGKIAGWDEILEQRKHAQGLVFEDDRAICRVHVYHKTWDCEQLGVKVASLDIFGPSSGEGFNQALTNAIAHCQKEGYQLVCARLAYDALAFIHAAEKAGFYLVDAMNVFIASNPFEHLPTTIPLPLTVEYNVALRESDQTLAHLKTFAGQVFAHGRIQNDPHLSSVQKQAFSQALCASLLSHASHENIVLFHEQQPVGFCSYGHQQDIPSLGYLWMIGVDEQFQGQGLGKILTSICIRQALKTYDSIEIATQINNYPALRLYSSLNLPICSAIATFHLWL